MMKFTGKGIFTYPDGKTYEGDFVEDLPDGVGLMTYANCDTYDGHWVAGKMQGHGTYRFYDYNRDRLNGFYEGFFVNSQFNGWGKREYQNKAIYCGNWAEGKRSGEGQILFATGESYSGLWKDDILPEGVAHFPDGSFYSGHFSNYHFSGFGTYFAPDGTMLQGIWDGSTLVKGVEITTAGEIKDIEDNQKLV